jgi:hypothetical protein
VAAATEVSQHKHECATHRSQRLLRQGQGATRPQLADLVAVLLALRGIVIVSTLRLLCTPPTTEK